MSEYKEVYYCPHGKMYERVTDKPTLNENQQKWLSRLKANRKWYGQSSQHAVFSTLLDGGLPEIPEKEFMQVLQVFSAWVLEQEDE